MKKGIVFILIICMLLSLSLPAFAAGSGTGESLYTNTTELASGFTFTNAISYNSAGGRVETFAIETAAGGDVHPVVIACDTIYGGMTIDEVITYAEEEGYTVLGAVNSDFFSMSTRVPLGIVIEDGIYKSSPEEENILLYAETGTSILSRTEVAIHLLNNGGGERLDPATGETSPAPESEITVSHLNKARNDYGGLYLFTEYYSDEPVTTSDGWAVKMKITEGEMKLGSELTLAVEEILSDTKEFTIGEGYIVLSAAAGSGYSEVMEGFSVGDTVTMSISCDDEQLLSAKWATGCGDLLVEDGKMTDSANWDSALFGSNPRTAIGLKEDGSVVYYVVDGRISGYSSGAKMSEVAADFIDMGCQFAANLDGGASTVMALKKPGTERAEVISRPSNGNARVSAAYILFVTDCESDGTADRLYLKQDGEFLLVGSSIELEAYAADKTLSPAQVPENVHFMTSGILRAEPEAGAENVYTAANEGDDVIVLNTGVPGGPLGSGTIHNIAAVDELKVTDAATGKTPVLSGLKKDDTIQLSVELTKLTRPVHFDIASVKFDLSENVGTVSDDGLVTITGETGATGQLSVTAGGITETFDVALDVVFEDINDHWAKTYIETLYADGIVNGTGEGRTFSPNEIITRGDFVLMLWRAMGMPEAAVPASFEDVTPDMYYFDAISWAQEAGVTNGTGNGLFEPKGTLTREQSFTLVYRTLFMTELPEDYDTSILDLFSDSNEISDYARIASSELVLAGILEGSGGKLSPLNEISRAEMAKILCMALYTQY